jgi:hypothetical protein
MLRLDWRLALRRLLRLTTLSGWPRARTRRPNFKLEPADDEAGRRRQAR